MKIKIEVSARHIHLSRKDLDVLFGAGYKLTKLKDLSQKGEFAAQETLSATRQGKTLKLRIVGPVRKQSQIELSLTEAINCALKAPVRLSGNLKGAPTMTVAGPKGLVGSHVIVAKRHLHCSRPEAKKLSLKKNQKVKVAVQGERGLIFENVIVRIADNYTLACHLDTDEANAAGLGKVCGYGELIPT